MTLQQLRYFMAVCQVGSTTAAAEMLFVSQPAVSKAIQDLEYEWGVQLFHRQKKRLVITQVGEEAYRKTYELLSMADDFSNAMNSAGAQQNNISIVMNSTMSILLFPTLIADFKAACPDVKVDLIEVKEHADQRFVDDPGADVLFMSNAQHLFAENKRFKSLFLWESEYVVTAGKKTAAGALEKIGRECRSDKRMIVDYYPRDIYGDSFIPKPLKSFLNGNPIQIMSSQFVLNIDLIRSGEAYGFTFREIAGRYSDVVAVPLDPPWRQQIHAYYPALKENKRALASLIAFLKGYDYARLGEAAPELGDEIVKQDA